MGTESCWVLIGGAGPRRLVPRRILRGYKGAAFADRGSLTKLPRRPPPLPGWRRCPMAGPALGALLLLPLLSAGRGVSTGAESELCPQEGALRCPQLQLCCGACRLFSCCPAGEAQLEGGRCPRKAQTAQPPIQDEPGKCKTTSSTLHTVRSGASRPWGLVSVGLAAPSAAEAKSHPD